MRAGHRPFFRYRHPEEPSVELPAREPMEGPGSHRVADELARFADQRIDAVGGNADQPLDRLECRA